MRKALAIMLLPFILTASSLTSSAERSASPQSEGKLLSEINIRDPFVLLYDNIYYMYGTGAATKAGYGCYVSSDLEHWTERVNVFSADDSFDGDGCYWAPECHYYNGMFYLFATYHSKSTQHRGVSVFRSESPTGPFTEISDGHITPHDIDAIDGTLYIDEDGQPWMVFVHEWTSMPDEVGLMCAAKLSDDLSAFISEPVDLFGAKDTVWASGKITDGPFMYKTKSGRLLMLWSNSNSKGYSVGIAYSSNGRIDGKWEHQICTLYSRNRGFELDGGHGMIFTDKDGRLMLSVHSPNSSTPEHMTTAVFYELEDIGCSLVIKSDRTALIKFLDYALLPLNPILNRIFGFFRKVF